MSAFFLGEETRDTSYEQARAVVLPIPYEKTTSYGSGTARGPQAIIEASAYVELYDEVYETEVWRQGIYTDTAPVFTGETEQDFDILADRVDKHLKNGKFVVSLGGEHAISYPLVKAFRHHYPDLTVIQFDAHSDLRDSYEGSIYSHASVMKRLYDSGIAFRQIGIRSQCVEEARLIREQNLATLYAHHTQSHWRDFLSDIRGNVYITFDVDFWDPSLMPATGTPEPGGFFWDETMAMLAFIFSRARVVGCDVVELSPVADWHHPDFTTAKLVYKMITLKLKDSL